MKPLARPLDAPTLALTLAAPSFACRARPGAGTPDRGHGVLGSATVADAASRLRKEA